jgi:hypothetical protein
MAADGPRSIFADLVTYPLIGFSRHCCKQEKSQSSAFAQQAVSRGRSLEDPD